MSKGHRVIALLLVAIIALFVANPASQRFCDYFIFTDSMKQAYKREKESNAAMAESAARIAAIRRLAAQVNAEAKAEREQARAEAKFKRKLDAEMKLIEARSAWDSCAANPQCQNTKPRP